MNLKANWLKILPWALVGILTLILVLRKTETITITTPEKTGQFNRDSNELTPIILHDTIVKEGAVEVIQVPNPVNETLLKKYEKAKDSIEQLNLYKDAVTERTYKEVYQDSTQSITVTSDVIGTLKGQSIDYTVFPQTITKQVKLKRINVYVGAETTTKLLTSITPKVYIQTPKILYSGGYNLQTKNYTVGIAFKIL